MKNFYNIESFDRKWNMLELHTLAGSNIEDCIDEAINIASNMECNVNFKFNDILVIVNKHSDPVAAYEEWYKQIRK